MREKGKWKSGVGTQANWDGGFDWDRAVGMEENGQHGDTLLRICGDRLNGVL